MKRPDKRYGKCEGRNQSSRTVNEIFAQDKQERRKRCQDEKKGIYGAIRNRLVRECEIKKMLASG